jgi:tRNA 2-thiouridine synthesizing protein A
MSVWRAGRRGAHGAGKTAAPDGGSPAGGTAAGGAAADGAATGGAAPAAAAGMGTRGAGPAAPEAALTVDALGRKCPIPIIMVAERIREVPVGSVIAVLADDAAARTDIPAWCGMKSQHFVTEVALERGWSFLVRREY